MNKNVKKIITLVFTLIISALSQVISEVSQARDSLDGCGLGWEVTSQETFLGTSTRGTTNLTVPPTFGMTTGTLGCKKISLAENEGEALSYVAQNYPSLKQQLAIGEGEYVDALVEVMGCGNKSDKIRSNYRTVVAPAKDGVELYKNLKEAMCS